MRIVRADAGPSMWTSLRHASYLVSAGVVSTMESASIPVSVLTPSLGAPTTGKVSGTIGGAFASRASVRARITLNLSSSGH